MSWEDDRRSRAQPGTDREGRPTAARALGGSLRGRPPAARASGLLPSVGFEVDEVKRSKVENRRATSAHKPG